MEEPRSLGTRAQPALLLIVGELCPFGASVSSAIKGGDNVLALMLQNSRTAR